jgi:hypothetical protein
MTPTAEQYAILEAARLSSNSLMIEAMAGCAKTTSLQMLSKHLPVVPSVALAFNVKIKKELETRFPKHFDVLTLNGLGHRAWSKAIDKQCRVDTNKLFNTIKETLNDLNLKNTDGLWSTVSTLLKGARHAGLVPEPFCREYPGMVEDDWPEWEAIGDAHYIDIGDDAVYVARRALQSLIKQSFQGSVDYDDQIYMSVLFGGKFPKYRITLVDEAQDLSPMNHRQIAQTCIDRLIVCGDPRQAIYAFRGADSSSMNNMQSLRQDWQHFPLTLTWRCPHAIVARQQQHAPGFTAAAEAPEGQFLDWSEKKTWGIEDVIEIAENRQIALLCRNNAPIIAAALRIIRTGRGCTIIGNDIGKTLIVLSKKILPKDDTPAEECVRLIAEWRDREISLAQANGKDERVAIIHDRADCLLAVIDSGRALTSGAIRDTLGKMFAKESLQITLSTGHKAKGLEWPVVVHLDPWRIPSPFARKALDNGNKIPLQQDLNLRYVIETRTKHTLINANLENMVCP